ncbi:DUF115 domain-containing protein [Nocardioides koreensis]|uniref:DUF115 domain-containing protein n=2 Tax=Nocardioides koreensis TaxID=433651 RepID=A0ABN2Z7F1_9ACTN
MADIKDAQDDTTQGRTGDLLRRSAVSLLGERRARQMASHGSDLKVIARNKLTRQGRVSSRALEAFRDQHRGERCIIIGNGPSLNETPMALLKNEFTFGLNRLYMMFDELGFSTTYHVVVNKYVVEQCTDDFMALRSPLFTTAPNRQYLADGGERYFLERLTGPRFSGDVSRGVWEGATVTYVAMQLAYFMGFEKVVLIGVDHNFVSKGEPHKLVESQGGDANHFNPGYFGKGFKWQLPDLETSEIAYRLAGEAFAADDRCIVDATVGGKLDVFPKVDLATELNA